MIAGLAFAFNERVAVRSARTVNAWVDNDYAPMRSSSDLLSNVWLVVGDDFVRARLVSGHGAGLSLRNVTIYERAGPTLEQVIDIERAVQDGTRWRFENVRSYDANMNLVRRQARSFGLAGVTPDRFTLAKVEPDEHDFQSLRQSIAELEAAGRPTDEARSGLWHKLSGPLAVVLMPVLAALAAFGLARSGKVLLRAGAGMALGFAYFVIDNLSLALGNVGTYPAWLAAFAPLFLFLLIGESLLIRSEE